MIYPFCLFLILASLELQAKTLPALDQTIKCEKDIEKLLQSWESKNEWFRQVDPLPNARAFRSPTTKLGVWIEFSGFETGDIRVQKISADNTETAHWGQENCSPTFGTKKTPHKSFAGRHRFTDKDLSNLLNLKKSGVIYVWSPHRVYSVTNYTRIKNDIESMGLDFVPVLDPFATIELAKTGAKKYKFSYEDRWLDSIELQMLGTTHHMPSLVVFKNKSLSHEIIVGVKNHSELKQLLERDLEKLRED